MVRHSAERRSTSLHLPVAGRSSKRNQGKIWCVIFADVQVVVRLPISGSAARVALRKRSFGTPCWHPGLKRISSNRGLHHPIS